MKRQTLNFKLRTPNHPVGSWQIAVGKKRAEGRGKDKSLQKQLDEQTLNPPVGSWQIAVGK